MSWLLRSPLCFLVFSWVDSSSLSSGFLPVSCTVGGQAVLPCSWKPRLTAPASCHIQWQTTDAATVFEQCGARRWQAEEYGGRVEVPEENLGSGDCSLLINDVQFGDTGQYESFMVVDGQRDRKTRVFIQGVKLSVVDHRSQQVRGPGEDLVLDLHTRHSVRVVFQGRNSSRWTELWTRAVEDRPRVEKHPLKEQLTLRNLQRSDDGAYKVLDERGLAVSIVELAVHGQPTDVPVHRLEDEPSGGAVGSSRSLFPLVTCLLIGRLL